jgi:hypothetical protein
MFNVISSLLPAAAHRVAQVAGVEHDRAITRIERTTMTKLNADNSTTFSTETGAKVRNRKTTVKVIAPAFPVALKTLLSDIIKANPNYTGDTKAMRVVLRKSIKAHNRNDAWTFNTQAQYDAARCLFDAAYAAKLAKPVKAKVVKAPVAPVKA